MHVAIDVDETISRYPELYRELMAALRICNHKVTILTGRGTPDGRRQQLEEWGIRVIRHYSQILIVNDGSATPPELATIKAKAVIDQEIDVLFDDMPEIIEACQPYCLALRSPK